MISLLKNKYRFIAIMAVASFLTVIVGCAEHGTMTKDEDMSKDNGETLQKEGSGSYRY
jgi:hypothetical protein